MKIIKASAIQGITASSSHANYPVSNLLNGSPKKKWQAASSSVTMASLDVSVFQRTGGLGMVGIVAEEAFVSISDPNGITWENIDWGGPEPLAEGGLVIDDPDYVVDLSDNISDGAGGYWDGIEWQDVPDAVEITKEWIETGDDYKTLWVSFTQFESAVNITIELRKSATNPDILAAGVLVIGEVIDLPFTQYPLNEGMVDYSISRELSNGAHYYKRRDIVRTFSGSMIVRRDEYFHAFMRDLARVFGLTPFMVLLADWSMDFVVYGRFSQLPSGSHPHPRHSIINFAFIEEL